MPIINPDDTPPVEQPNTVRIAPPDYKGVVVDTRYVPSKSLATRVEGSPWTIDYYSQVIDSDNAVAGQNVTRSAIYQQYRLIKSLELKVTVPLTTSQQDDTKTMLITGTANCYPVLIPNTGDMFLADVGDGQEGIFKVTTVEKKSIFKDAIYQIEYQLIDYATPVRRADLDRKVVQTLRFVKDYLLHGQNPLLFEDEFLLGEKLQGWYYELVTMYFKSFASNEHKTLLVPGQDSPIYDHFLLRNLLKVVDTWDAPQIRNMRLLNCDGDDAMESNTIWDALVRRDRKLIRMGAQRMGLIFATMMPSDPMQEGVYYSGVQYLVYPQDQELTVDYDVIRNKKEVLEKTLDEGLTRVKSVQDLFAGYVNMEGLPYKDSPLTHQVLEDDFYVFTQNFYDDNTDPNQQSKLELCVRDYLDGKALDNRLLLTFCELCHSWGALERFYYIPVLLILLKASMRRI